MHQACSKVAFVCLLMLCLRARAERPAGDEEPTAITDVETAPPAPASQAPKASEAVPVVPASQPVLTAPSAPKSPPAMTVVPSALADQAVPRAEPPAEHAQPAVATPEARRTTTAAVPRKRRVVFSAELPPQPGARKKATLLSIDARLFRLEEKLDELPLGGPRFVAALGFIGAPILLIAGGKLYTGSFLAEDSDSGDLGVALIVLSPAALLAGVLGCVAARHRSRERAPYELESRKLRQQKAALLNVVPRVARSSYGVEVRAAF